MFTGIVEALGSLQEVVNEGTNRHFIFSAPFAKELKVDQSLSHNGVCLTVTSQKDDIYNVTAIDETLKKTNLGTLQPGDRVNLERCLLFNGRVDGHLVQGHVDQTGTCTQVADQNGSWLFTFTYDESHGNVTVEKGSVCVNGVSLTVVDSQPGRFSVAIIPYTFHHTNFNTLKVGSLVNLEFDVIGKYVKRLMPDLKG